LGRELKLQATHRLADTGWNRSQFSAERCPELIDGIGARLVGSQSSAERCPELIDGIGARLVERLIVRNLNKTFVDVGLLIRYWAEICLNLSLLMHYSMKVLLDCSLLSVDSGSKLIKQLRNAQQGDATAQDPTHPVRNAAQPRKNSRRAGSI
jgi:hypothetical protein